MVHCPSPHIFRGTLMSSVRGSYAGRLHAAVGILHSAKKVLRSRWGQVKSTKGFGNFATPTMVPQGFWDMGNKFGKTISFFGVMYFTLSTFHFLPCKYYNSLAFASQSSDPTPERVPGA